MFAPLTPGFMVLQGNHLEDLRDILVQWLNNHPLAPLEEECILVQSNGIAQWLKMALANEKNGQGIAAAVNVQLPGRFIWQAYRSVFPSLPTQSPFDKGPLTWRIYRLLNSLEAVRAQLGNNAHVLSPLKRFLLADKDPRRLYQLAGHLADLYDQYQLYRADWLEHWQAGHNTLLSAEGQTIALDEQQLWQPYLWRLVGADVASEGLADDFACASRAHINQAFINACRSYPEGQRPQHLPRRVIVFSISSLPRQTLELLQAISRFTQVMVFATNPSKKYWGDLIEGKALLKAHYKRMQQNEQVANLSLAEIRRHGHPLLASWGKQGRDFLHLLDEHDHPEQYRQLFSQQNIDVFSEPKGNQLLHQLQSDILHLRPLEERIEMASSVAESDTSLTFTVAHSRQREVEILHDQLLASFAEAAEQGRPLEPREIMVMVPHIDEYAPHIDAVFGRYQRQNEQRDPRHLPYHIADQSQRGQNTLLIAFEKLLNLPRLRFTASEMSDLLDTPALRQRIGLSEEDLPLLRHWIADANIRWGLDAKQREQLHLPNEHTNTWLFGIERMLLGYASGSSTAWQGIQPYTEVAGLSAAIVGPLVSLVNRLQSAMALLNQQHSNRVWLQHIAGLLESFFSPVSAEDEWALDHLSKALDSLQDTWQMSALGDAPLPLEVVREELLANLDQPSLAQRFLAGSINFATLMPMRALPFRQVWILGMNDNEYPRQTHAPDFDLMANDYRPGDRSRREDDRYLFLEALLAAREKLTISWIGRDIRDNAELPASVVVNQLRDHLAAGWQGAGKDLLEQLTIEHPLQPFSTDYFAPQRDARLYTYAKEWRAVHNPPPQQDANTELKHEHPVIDSAALARFLRRPVSYFYRHSLGMQWQDEASSLDAEPFTLDGLEQWHLNNNTLALVRELLADNENGCVETALQEALSQQANAGSLPLGSFGNLVQQSTQQRLSKPLTAYQNLLAGYATAVPVALHSFQAHGVTLQDAIGGLRQQPNGETIQVVLQASRLYKGGQIHHPHVINHWPKHLFAQLQQPVTTHLLGPDSHLVLNSMAKAEAEALLADALHVYYQGIHSVLPLPCSTAFASLTERGKPHEVYEGNYHTSGEMAEHPGFAQHWPNYEALCSDQRFGANNTSGDNGSLVQLIYRPVMGAVSTYTGEDDSNE